MSESNEYVIIIDKSAGNESVGTMWKETKIFYGYHTLDEVMRWALDSPYHDDPQSYSKINITITKPHEEENNHG